MRYRYSKIGMAVGVVVMLALILTVSPAVAQEQTTVTYDINWGTYSSVDQAINRASSNATTNIDTWGAWKPDGVYAGSFTPESELALDMMMNIWYEDVTYTNIDTASITDLGYNTYPEWYDGQKRFGGKVVLAQKVKYSAEQIMSGAAHMYIRLPINADDYHKGMFYVYQCTNDTDMTIENITDIQTPTYNHTSRAIYNESGSYTGMTFYDNRFNYHPPDDSVKIAQATWNTTETSKSTSQPYVYQDRVYVPLQAPIQPDVYYSFVTVAYPSETVSGGQTRIFLTQDSISTTGARSSQALIAFATDNTPYEIDYEIHRPGVYLGYSTVFTQGYGDRISGHTYAFESGDEIHYRQYFEANTSGDYCSVMLPFLSTDNSNITVDIDLEYSNGDTYSMTDITGNDFILNSTSGVASSDVDYVDVIVTMQSDKRIGMFLTEPTSTDYNRTSSLLAGDYEYFETGDLSNANTASTINDYTSFYIEESTDGTQHRLFFNLFAPVHFGDGQWNYQIPVSTTDFHGMEWHSFADKVFCGAMGLVVTVAGVTPVGITISAVMGDSPTQLMEAGIDMVLHQRWDKLNEFADTAGTRLQDIFDTIGSGINAIGDFVKRVGNAIVTSLSWLVDQIVYYGSLLAELIWKVIAPFGTTVIAIMGGSWLWSGITTSINAAMMGKETAMPDWISDWLRRRKLK